MIHLLANHAGEPTQDWELAVGILGAIVFFLVWGFIWWLFADHIFPRIGCRIDGHNMWADGTGCYRCGRRRKFKRAKERNTQP